jgi:hypothetical protein
LEAMLSQLHRDLQGRVGQERRAFIIEIVSEAARQCWETHTSELGEARFTIIKAGGRKSAGGCGGCLGVFIVLLLTLCAVSAGAFAVWGALFGGIGADFWSAPFIRTIIL